MKGWTHHRCDPATEAASAAMTPEVVGDVVAQPENPGARCAGRWDDGLFERSDHGLEAPTLLGQRRAKFRDPRIAVPGGKIGALESIEVLECGSDPFDRVRKAFGVGGVLSRPAL